MRQGKGCWLDPTAQRDVAVKRLDLPEAGWLAAKPQKEVWAGFLERSGANRNSWLGHCARPCFFSDIPTQTARRDTSKLIGGMTAWRG